MRIRSYKGITFFIFCSISITLLAGCPILTTPPAMYSPTLEAGNGQLTASWVDPATWNWGDNNLGNDITEYHLRYRQVDSESWTEITSGITGTSHTITELTNGMNYAVQVRAVNAQGIGGWSASATARPIAPTVPPAAPGTMAAPTLEPGNRHLLVAWSAPADNGGSEITAYHLRHSTDGGTNWSEIIVLAAPAASYTIRGLRNGTSYEVQARAVNNEGTGTWSEIATETPLIVAAQQTPGGTAASLSLSAANTAIIARENPTVKLTTVEPGTLAANEISGTITVTPATAPASVTIPTVNAGTGIVTVSASTTAGTYLVYGENGNGDVWFAEYLFVTVSPATNAQLKTAVTAAIGDITDTNDSGIWGNTANLNYIITTAVTDMSDMFSDRTTFNGDISRWDTGRVTNMKQMFFTATAFNGDISGWDVSSVTNMEAIFRSARAFNGDISDWNVSAVINMSYIFTDAHAFNGDISGWDVSMVTNMSYMFAGAKVFNIDISGWNVGSVTDMSAMFNKADEFNQNLERWAVDNSVTTTDMFKDSGLDANPASNDDSGDQPNYPTWYTP